MTIKAKHRPIVIIINNEKELLERFLRCCFFHFINFPDRETMQQIVDVHFPAVKQDMVKDAMEIFFDAQSAWPEAEKAFNVRTYRLAGSY